MSFACSSPAGGMLFGVIIIIIIEGLSLLQSIPPTTANKQTQQPRPHAADRPPTRLGEPSTAPGREEGGGQPVLSFEQCFILFCSFPLLFVFAVGGLGFELCVFVAGWRHAIRSEWPFIIIIISVLRYPIEII